MDNNYIDDLIKLFLTAIDNQNKNEIEILFNKNKNNNIEKHIVLEMYPLIFYVYFSENKNLVKYLIEQGLDINKIINPVKHHYLMLVCAK